MLSEWLKRIEDRERNVRSILKDGNRERGMIRAAESHAAMRQRTRAEAAELNRQARANGAMLAVQPWETKI